MTFSPLLCSLQEISVTYKGESHPAVEAINLQVYQGKCIAIIGESGSGKSTLAKLLASLLPQSAIMSGQLKWHGIYADRAPLGGKDIAYIFQDPTSALNPIMPVGRQIGEAAEKHLKIKGKILKDHVLSLMTKLQLPDVANLYNAYPHQLSGGQQQRVAIGAAISAYPSIIISDEATSALDNETQADIIRLLNDLARDSGATLISITHDLGVAASLSDEMAVMQNGRIVEIASTKTILTQPTHPYSTKLVASMLDIMSTPIIQEKA